MMNEPKPFGKKPGEPSKSDSSGNAGDKKNPFPPSGKDGSDKKPEGDKPVSEGDAGGGSGPGDGKDMPKNDKSPVKGGSLFQKLVAGIEKMEGGQPQVQPGEQGQPQQQPQGQQPPDQGQPTVEQGQPPAAGSGGVDFGAVVDFFAQNPDPNDDAFHAFCEQNSFDPHQAEAMAYSLATIAVKLLRGGRSGDPSFDINSVDPDELQMGIEVESEHIDDPSIQKKIALDHLAEMPDYYSMLSQMENGGQGQDQSGGSSEDMDGSLNGSDGRSGDGY
jgi:hypothetical protein